MSLNGVPSTGWLGLKRQPAVTRTLTPPEALALLLLADAGDCHGELAPTTYEALAEGSMISPRTLERAVAALVGKKLVARRRGQNVVQLRLRCAAFPRAQLTPVPQMATATTGSSEAPPFATATTGSSEIPQPSPVAVPTNPQPSPVAVAASRVKNPEKDSTDKEGESDSFVDRGAPHAPPQIEIFNRVFAPVRDKPLESWRWGCITSVVHLDDRSLTGWQKACERWRDNGQSPEKVSTLVKSYGEHFQPQVGPGSPQPAAPEPLPEEGPRAPVRIIAPEAIKAALKSRHGPLKAALEGLLATAEVVA